MNKILLRKDYRVSRANASQWAIPTSFRTVCWPSRRCSTVAGPRWRKRAFQVVVSGKVWRPHLDDTVNTLGRCFQQLPGKPRCVVCRGWNVLQQQKCDGTCCEECAKLRARCRARVTSGKKRFSRAWSCRFLFRPGNLPWPIFSVVYPLIRADYICFNHGQRKLENFLLMECRSAYNRFKKNYWN